MAQHLNDERERRKDEYNCFQINLYWNKSISGNINFKANIIVLNVHLLYTFYWCFYTAKLSHITERKKHYRMNVHSGSIWNTKRNCRLSRWIEWTEKCENDNITICTLFKLFFVFVVYSLRLVLNSIFFFVLNNRWPLSLHRFVLWSYCLFSQYARIQVEFYEQLCMQYIQFKRWKLQIQTILMRWIVGALTRLAMVMIST